MSAAVPTPPPALLVRRAAFVWTGDRAVADTDLLCVDGRVAAVARADVADVATAVLRGPADHAGATYALTGPEALTMAELAAAHATALQAHFPQPVDLLGISTGGAIALQLAVDQPAVLRRLVVAAAASWLGQTGREKLSRYGALIAQGKSGAPVLASVLAPPATRWPMCSPAMTRRTPSTGWPATT